MSKAPERIWTYTQSGTNVRIWRSDSARPMSVEYVRADRIEELEAQLADVTAERDEAIPRAYQMALEAAGNDLLSLIAYHKATSRSKGTYPYIREQTINAIRNLTPPDDLVEQVMKPK